MEIIKRTIALVVVVYLITLVYLNTKIINNNNIKVDTIIVLGAKVKKDRPTYLLKKRLDTAIKYYHDHPQVNVIVTGGQGQDESYAEAKVMKEYLVANKVPKDKVYVENQSTSTFENLRCSKIIVDKYKLGPKIGIVTNKFHIKRALLIAHNVFNQKIEGIVAPNSSLKNSLKPILREPLAFYKSLLFDRD